MKNSAEKIRTSHVGRLPVPSGFEETALRLPRGEVGGEEVVAQVVPVVADVVKRQVEIGLDCIGDGEYWSALDIKWFDQQMTGLSTRLLKPGEVGSMQREQRGLRPFQMEGDLVIAAGGQAFRFAYQDLRGLRRSLSLAVPVSRSQVHLTSLAVKRLPSYHLTPWRSGKVSSSRAMRFQCWGGVQCGGRVG
jgi:hypothetical protein